MASEFATKNNLYKYIFEQPMGHFSSRMPFESAKVFRDWLSWIANKNDLTTEEALLVENLIEATDLNSGYQNRFDKG